MRLRFVTSNPGKVREAATALRTFGLEVEAADAPTLEPQADRLETVARAKAESVRGRVAPPYFVEDAGLFVDALQGFPGVYSAYAYKTIGWQGILALLAYEEVRTATFQAVVALVTTSGEVRTFEGECPGRIVRTPAGSGGFGFDPIFVPEGESRTFAELPAQTKSEMSHRGRALAAMGRALSQS